MRNENNDTADDASAFIGLFESRIEASAARRKGRVEKERKASGLPVQKSRSDYRCFPTSYRVSEVFKNQLALVARHLGTDASLCDALHFAVEQAALQFEKAKGPA